MPLDPNRFVKPAKKLRKLLKKTDRKPDPDAVHDLRTNIRRIEAVLEVLSLEPDGKHSSIIKPLGRIRKRAGKVRDIDVLTGFASSVHVQNENDCMVRLLENLGARR